MAILNIFVLIGLVRANRFYNEKVAASLWALVAFTSGLLSLTPFFSNLVKTAISFAVAWVVFRFLKRFDELSLPWLGIFIAGSGSLLYLL